LTLLIGTAMGALGAMVAPEIVRPACRAASAPGSDQVARQAFGGKIAKIRQGFGAKAGPGLIRAATADALARSVLVGGNGASSRASIRTPCANVIVGQGRATRSAPAAMPGGPARRQ
jgi:hypothetical protein